MTTAEPVPTVPPSRRWLTRRRILLGCLGLPCLALVLLVGYARLVAWWNDRPLDNPAGQLALISDRDGRRQPYLASADGSGQRRLADLPGEAWSMAWSPDGRTLAVAMTRDAPGLYLLDVAAGGPPRQVALPPGGLGELTWSPDGTRLAMWFNPEGGSTGVYALTLGPGTGPNEPVLLAELSCRELAWSPAGDRLACADFEGVFVVDTAGGGYESVAPGLPRTSTPAWSPDGRFLAFAAIAPPSVTDEDIYRVNADGTGLVRLTDRPDREYSPAWSPDGQRLAFVSQSPNNTDMGDHVYVMGADGSDRQLVLIWASQELTWSPDGKTLAFYSNRGRWGTDGEIYTANPDGTGLTLVTAAPAWDGQPRWRP